MGCRVDRVVQYGELPQPERADASKSAPECTGLSVTACPQSSLHRPHAPFGFVPFVAQPERLSLSWIPPRLSFFSHISPVCLSLTGAEGQRRQRGALHAFPRRASKLSLAPVAPRRRGRVPRGGDVSGGGQAVDGCQAFRLGNTIARGVAIHPAPSRRTRPTTTAVPARTARSANRAVRCAGNPAVYA